MSPFLYSVLPQYILNVTPDLPNVFEDSGDIEYLQIPITDHWSQDLAVHFPAAIQFIGKHQFIRESVVSLAMPRLNDVWWLVSELFNKSNVDHIKQLTATLLGQWVVVNQWLVVRRVGRGIR